MFQKILILIFFIVSSASFTNVLHAEWKVETSSKLDYIIVKTDGTVQKGDNLIFYISVGSGGKCNSVEHLFTFYTMTKHPDILQIQGKKIRKNREVG